MESDSPTQTIGAISASISAFTFRLTEVSVSLNISRRSEWPTIQNSQPASLIIGIEISPVKAPDSSQWTFWAPTAIFVLSKSITVYTDLISIEGGQTTISTLSHLRLYWLHNCWVKTIASDIVLFIFQLPAIKYLRIHSPYYNVQQHYLLNYYQVCEIAV